MDRGDMINIILNVINIGRGPNRLKNISTNSMLHWKEVQQIHIHILHQRLEVFASVGLAEDASSVKECNKNKI